MNEGALRKLIKSKVLILGVGAGGTVAAGYLAAAGVGHLGLLDDDVVSESLLSQQILYCARDLDRPRVEALERRLHEIAPTVQVHRHMELFDAHSAEDIFAGYEVIVDCLSDWQEKLLASDTSMRLARPLIHSGYTGVQFQIFVMSPGRSACLRCVFSQLGMEDYRPERTGAGHFGPLMAMGGGFQASETIKLITRLGVIQPDELVQFDGLRREFSTVRGLSSRPDCPDCGRYS